MEFENLIKSHVQRIKSCQLDRKVLNLKLPYSYLIISEYININKVINIDKIYT